MNWGFRMKRILLSVSAMTFMMLTTSLLVTPALAQGLFDMDCPECHGTGKVACDNCDGTGSFACTNCDGIGVVTCDRCDGSGSITTTVDCTTCYGTGEIEPSIIKKSMNGWETLVGLDWVARVEGTFHNEEDIGTYGKATSKVTTLTEEYYHTSPRTYFPPHEDVKITIDTPEIEFGEDWMYTIYVSSADDITCPDCDGSGAKSVITTCPDCIGIGTVDCQDCDGTGVIDCLNCNGAGTLTCPVCNGSGFVFNWPMFIAVIIIVVVVVGSVIGIIVRASRKRKLPE